MPSSHRVEVQTELKEDPETGEEPEVEEDPEIAAEPEVDEIATAIDEQVIESEVRKEEQTDVAESLPSKAEAADFDFLAFNQGPFPDEDTLDELLMNVWQSEVETKDPPKNK